MKALLVFFAMSGLCNLAVAAQSIQSEVTIAPNTAYPSSVVNVTITGVPAEDLYNALDMKPADAKLNGGREIKQSGSTVCSRQVVADEVRQASIVKHECIVYVSTKAQ